MNEIQTWTAIKTELNRTIADLWMSYEVGAVRISKTKVNIHFFGLNHGSVYIPFVNKDKKLIIISSSTDV